MNISKSDLKKKTKLAENQESSNLPNKQFHNLLVCLSDVGLICRQELVSMIPVYFLQLTKTNEPIFVLDMCASPGSKTKQILEQTKHPNSIIIANDVNIKRCYTLVTNINRLANSNLIVTNHQAQFFPKINVLNEKGFLELKKFDKILCDVPCTGDGTLRKNKLIWKTWNFKQPLQLHKYFLNIFFFSKQK